MAKQDRTPQKEPVGYFILIAGPQGWEADWDGAFHPSRSEADYACLQAKEAGYDARVAALTLVEAGDAR